MLSRRNRCLLCVGITVWIRSESVSAFDRNHCREWVGIRNEIAEEVAHMPLTESQRRLLDERLADEERHPDDVEPWAKAKDDILREL